MRKKRDAWKAKTAQAKASLRYKTKEHRPVKIERDKYKQKLRQANLEIKGLKQQKTGLSVSNKSNLVFLALQLFLFVFITLILDPTIFSIFVTK